MKHIYFLGCLAVIIFSISPFSGFAAGPQTLPMVQGEIVDSAGRGVAYASVALVSDSRKIVAASVCQQNGVFELAKVPAGKYMLEISCIGYAPARYAVEITATRTDIGAYALREGVAIDNVVVSADRPLVRSTVDRLIYDVENDPDAATANSLKILNKIPFVQVDKATDKIKVMGEEGGFVITLNGKKSVLLSESNQYVAKMLEASRLKQIELITSPDGQYTNQTAVINIVTKSSLPDGLVGYAGIDVGDDVHANANFGITSKIGRFIYDITYTYWYMNQYGSKNQTMREDYTNNDYRFLESYTRNSPAGSNEHTVGIKASYDLSKNDLLTVNFGTALKNDLTRIFTHNTYRNISQEITRENEGISRNKTDNAAYQGGINYQRSFDSKPGRLFTVQYGFDTKKNDMMYDLATEGLVDYTGSVTKTQNNLDNVEHTAAVDFYNPISAKQSYYFTAKYVHRDYGSDAWLSDLNGNPIVTTQLDNLNYIQQVTSLAGNYSLRTQKIMLTGEAALEYAQDNINFQSADQTLKKDNTALVVDLRMTYRPTSKSTFILSVEKSAFRPDITYLNPYENTSVPGQIQKGNPNLDNERKYSGLLLYRYFLNKKLSLNSLVRYFYSDNSVQSYSYVTGDGTLVTTYGNIAKQQGVYISVGVDYMPFSWLTIDLSGRLAYQQYSYSDTRNAYWDQYYQLNLTADLWKGGYFDIFMSYTNPYATQVANIQSRKQHLVLIGNFELAQDIGKHLKLSATIWNPWKTYLTQKVEEQAPDFYSYREEQVLGRQFYFRLTYNFGRFKDSVKNSQRRIMNSDRTKTE